MLPHTSSSSRVIFQNSMDEASLLITCDGKSYVLQGANRRDKPQTNEEAPSLQLKSEIESRSSPTSQISFRGGQCLIFQEVECLIFLINSFRTVPFINNIIELATILRPFLNKIKHDEC